MFMREGKNNGVTFPPTLVRVSPVTSGVKKERPNIYAKNSSTNQSLIDDFLKMLPSPTCKQTQRIPSKQTLHEWIKKKIIPTIDGSACMILPQNMVYMGTAKNECGQLLLSDLAKPKKKSPKATPAKVNDESCAVVQPGPLTQLVEEVKKLPPVMVRVDWWTGQGFLRGNLGDDESQLEPLMQAEAILPKTKDSPELKYKPYENLLNDLKAIQNSPTVLDLKSKSKCTATLVVEIAKGVFLDSKPITEYDQKPGSHFKIDSHWAIRGSVNGVISYSDDINVQHGEFPFSAARDSHHPDQAIVGSPLSPDYISRLQQGLAACPLDK